MPMPYSLRQAIEEQAAAQSLSALTEAAAELSQKYREQTFPDKPFIAGEAHRLAYAAVRMPATFAAASAALAEAAHLAPELKIETLLDLGAGTGAASWAAMESFDSLRQVTLIEQDRQLIELGRKLAQASEHDALRLAEWRAANLRTLREFTPHDLVLCSYSLGEIATAAPILNAAWQASQKLLVIIEPGTMKGFEVIRAAREQLIEAGGFLLAPCPHRDACPMALSKNDWCHFAARFERSALHRRLKGGTLGYEDEKFSYVAFAKQAAQSAPARILRHPLRHAGYTQLQLCAAGGLQTVTVTKRDKEAWRRVRKADWGDAWDNGSTNNPAE
ncbi:MAG TPA: small ribosomal subunit Rsm22 family protein [Blastocatellia bacterium]|nr:small ribosomal subunit Rsm22 family protein [Blastocatellia bacterium]HMX27044.1 small ribosomal subunit Rsm22 family protein [Blastocatellia bacterium]HMZ20062.1 small ribosomal subunit Rsm22 family protein [Blastocatellia bacterium]